MTVKFKKNDRVHTKHDPSDVYTVEWVGDISFAGVNRDGKRRAFTDTSSWVKHVNPFKVGDTVRHVKGRTGVVTAVWQNFPELDVKVEGGYASWSSLDVEAYTPPPKFKVGDRVVVTSTSPDFRGSHGVIIKIRTQGVLPIVLHIDGMKPTNTRDVCADEITLSDAPVFDFPAGTVLAIRDSSSGSRWTVTDPCPKNPKFFLGFFTGGQTGRRYSEEEFSKDLPWVVTSSTTAEVKWTKGDILRFTDAHNLGSSYVVRFEGYVDDAHFSATDLVSGAFTDCYTRNSSLPNHQTWEVV